MATVKDIMTRNVVSLLDTDPLKEAIRIMSTTHISSIIIKDKEGKLIGILTERDLIKKILANNKKNYDKMKISDVMTKNIISVDANKDISEVGEMMKEKNIRHMPVIEKGKLVGIITQTDIVMETKNIEKKNIKFMFYQNLQVIIIILFFIFLIIYFIMKKFM